MWFSKARRAFCLSVCRRSSAFLELYGRARSTAVAEAPSAPQPSCSTAPADGEWERCQALLQRFQSHVYIYPGHVPVQLCRETLTGIEQVLASSPARCSAAARRLWRDALALHSHLPKHDIRAAADAASVLLFSDQAQLGCRVCSQAASHPQFLQALRSEAELTGCLRLLSVHSMCACDSRAAFSAHWAAVLADSLDEAKHVIAAADKSRRAPMAHAMEVLAWSLDWLHHDSGTSDREALKALKTKLPRWLPFLFDEFDAAAAKPSSQSLALLPPRWLLTMATHAESDSDAATLERLLRHALGREEQYHGYAVFQLSSRVASLLVRRFPHHPSAAHAVAALGTALQCSSLIPYGTTQEGFDKALGVLTRMSGAQPYFAMQELLRSHSAEMAAKIQEQHGDRLTGNADLNWSTALTFTMRQVEAADPHWRVYLPETLRLLSDAGKSKQFWSLLQEYNAADASANISVAASLSRAMQLSGRWWHAVEVLDLLAGALPPRDTTEEQLMTTACAETLRVLLQAKRWKEALRVFLLVGDALPPTESAVVSRLLTSMSMSAPWRAALAAAAEKGLASDTTRIILRCLHAGASAAFLSHYHQQKMAAPIFAQHGRWDLARTLVEQRPSDVSLWRALVQAMEHCADAVDEPTAATVFRVPLPQGHWDDMPFVNAFARLCVQRGWLSLLSSHLSCLLAPRVSPASPVSGLRVEYEHLLRFLQSNRLPPAQFAFTNSYVVHQFMSCVTSRRVSVVAKLPAASASTKRQASTHLRVPYENLSAPRLEGDGTATVRATSARATTCLKEHCVFSSASGLIVGYKVPASALFASASGLLKVLGNSGVYCLAYHMSVASSGLFLLYPASASLTWYSVKLRVRLCVAVVPAAPYVPLLATSFFDRYAMRWRSGEGDRHEVEALLVAASGQEVPRAWRSLKMDLNAEGWGPVEPEAGAGDMYHILELQVSRRAPTNEGDAIPADVEVFACRERSLKPLGADASEAAEWGL
ncbi:conserved hypothetical protein [Leishmania infantum JPCM5]|uniref:Uncharacterized protein n=2 Tax=Leishmania infantum TaxID=5671 RepID=A4I4X8_LEIIN|nr:conserved hypothetical protein [Leishmania infantum JPCM5]CAC9510668.1 hypothetical_protein_-_conserved [Leishmania infantum]CAM69845.1 conserved hypothetical protein [Leishmania infantum JPCM5]SUZ43793.1 hypothetical_protein_-_conserved [Leishmania infantum]|eukprot:XP_001466797.1 conserved hypothetical protein [Leishmania infantum JPCM5]